MIVHVKNFGKIESADIDLSNLTIFVGENNSGKSYLMQLIYGLIDFLSEQDPLFFFVDFQYKFENVSSIRVKSDNSDFYNSLQNKLNSFIEKNKGKIIEKIFHTHSLTIDSLWVEFNNINYDFELLIKDNDDDSELNQDNRKIKKRVSIHKNGTEVYGVKYIGNSEDGFIAQAKSLFFTLILFDMLNFPMNIRVPQDKQLLFLPASRSGLMLLYTNFFANNNVESEENDKSFIDDAEDTKVEENEFGLTQPVYDFLTFLLKHKTSEMISDDNKAIISFIDKKIINGSMEKAGNTMRYKPDSSEKSLPIYLSSSLVSELTPIYQILSGIQRYKFILYDEIETCQHPTKQLQLARLLVRMVNAGYRMIVSTHSDTMASAINNILALSLKNNKADILEKLGYEEADILKSANVKAYQFIVENGKTRVIEVPSHFSIGLGFDFDLFNKANEKIYNDAIEIAEVD